MAKRRKIAIINTDGDSARAICRAAGIGDDGSEAQTFAEAGAAAEFLAGAGVSVVFFGIDQDSDATLQAIQKYTQGNSRAAVIGITDRVSSELLLEAVRAGVDEFVTAPLDDKRIRESVRNACRKKGILQPDGPAAGGKVFTVFSGKGGCGKTMLATNLAYHLTRIDNASVIVADLNLQFGNAATFLDLQPRYTIIDCLRGDGVVEDEMLVRMPCKHSSGLSIISVPDDPADSDQVRPEHVQALLEALRRRYDFVIADTSSSFDELNLAALDVSDKIILVSDTLVPSVRNTERCLRVFEKLGYDGEKIALVINRCDKRVGSRPKELQQAFGRPIAAFVPNDFETVMNSVDAGLPVAETAEKSAVVAAIRSLALSLAGCDGQKEFSTTGIFRKLSVLIRK
jgi:pilus assembly protein CpaE